MTEPPPETWKVPLAELLRVPLMMEELFRRMVPPGALDLTAGAGVMAVLLMLRVPAVASTGVVVGDGAVEIQGGGGDVGIDGAVVDDEGTGGFVDGSVAVDGLAAGVCEGDVGSDVEACGVGVAAVDEGDVAGAGEGEIAADGEDGLGDDSVGIDGDVTVVGDGGAVEREGTGGGDVGLGASGESDAGDGDGADGGERVGADGSEGSPGDGGAIADGNISTGGGDVGAGIGDGGAIGEDEGAAVGGFDEIVVGEGGAGNEKGRGGGIGVDDAIVDESGVDLAMTGDGVAGGLGGEPLSWAQTGLALSLRKRVPVPERVPLLKVRVVTAFMEPSLMVMRLLSVMVPLALTDEFGRTFNLPLLVRLEMVVDPLAWITPAPEVLRMPPETVTLTRLTVPVEERIWAAAAWVTVMPLMLRVPVVASKRLLLVMALDWSVRAPPVALTVPLLVKAALIRPWPVMVWPAA